MKIKAIATGIFGFIMAVAITGCALFPEREQQEPSRPAPVRPEQPAPVRPQQPAPTKQLPGVSAIGTRELMSRTQRIETAVKNEDWVRADKETNGMLADMTRFKENQPQTNDVDEMTKLNTEYAKLQTSVKGKNKDAALKNVNNLQAIINKL